MSEHPNRYVITALVKEGEKKGRRVFLYWSPEGGGWWQWNEAEGWAERFEAKAGHRFEDAVLCAPDVGPWYNRPDPETIEVREVPAIVKVMVY